MYGTQTFMKQWQMRQQMGACLLMLSEHTDQGPELVHSVHKCPCAPVTVNTACHIHQQLCQSTCPFMATILCISAVYGRCTTLSCVNITGQMSANCSAHATTLTHTLSSMYDPSKTFIYFLKKLQLKPQVSKPFSVF